MSGRTEIVRFEPSLLSSVVRFTERTLKRPRSEAFYRWRYVESPGFSLLALRGGECLALVSVLEKSFARPDGLQVYRETYDWHCLPDLRGSGLGILLMRKLMDMPEPMLCVGGTADTATLLPRLGWQDLPSAPIYSLPLGGRHIGALAKERFGIPEGLTTWVFGNFVRPWFQPRSRPIAEVSEAVLVPEIGAEVLGLYGGPTGYGFTQVPDPAYLRWLTQDSPLPNRFLAFHFRVKGLLRAWALAKLYPEGAIRSASIVDIFAREPDEALYRWMVAEILLQLAPFEPDKVTAMVTCPILQAALRNNRFLRRGEHPVRVWPKEHGIPQAPIHITYNHADEPWFPYPGTDDAHIAAPPVAVSGAG